jgi:catechol 2,3-dioxygenase-like lactoylglutathione lyase family enzyme
MATLRRIAPIFSVRNLGVALEFYQRLGFAVRTWDEGYGFATRDGLELHLGVVPAGDQHAGSAYLFVDDSEALAAEWRRAGVEVHAPQDTEWNQHEGAVVDPDGNVLRFGSPVRKRRSSAI